MVFAGPLLVGIFPIPAAAERVGRRLVIEGEVFIRYLYDLSYYRKSDPRSDNNDYNAFDLPRAELTLEGIATPGLVGRIVTEADRQSAIRADTDGDGDLETVRSPDTGRLELIFKNALIAWRPHRAFGVRAGIIPAVYYPAAEAAWTLRFVDRVAAHRLNIMGPEADMGVGIHGDFPAWYGSYELQLTNGEGYRKREKNRYKAVAARVSLRPFAGSEDPGWTLTLAGRTVKNDDPPGPEHDRRTGAVAQIAVGREDWFAGLSVFQRWWDYREKRKPIISRGASLFAGYFGFYNFGPFFRYDYYDPHASRKHGTASIADSRVGAGVLPADEDQDHTLWAGLFFRPTRRFDLAAYFRGRVFDERYQGGENDDKKIDPERQARLSLRLYFR